jgi:hypothetical protein
MITRRGAIAAGLAAIASRPATALAAGNDSGALAALAAYQREVLALYDSLLATERGRERETLARLRSRAAQVSAALPKTASPSAPADVTLAALIAAEEALIASYYTALQNLSEERHLKGAAAFMADAGRRVVVLRDLAGEPLVPRAFETGGA